MIRVIAANADNKHYILSRTISTLVLSITYLFSLANSSGLIIYFETKTKLKILGPSLFRGISTGNPILEPQILGATRSTFSQTQMYLLYPECQAGFAENMSFSWFQEKLQQKPNVPDTSCPALPRGIPWHQASWTVSRRASLPVTSDLDRTFCWIGSFFWGCVAEFSAQRDVPKWWLYLFPPIKLSF